MQEVCGDEAGEEQLEGAHHHGGGEEFDEYLQEEEDQLGGEPGGVGDGAARRARVRVPDGMGIKLWALVHLFSSSSFSSSLLPSVFVPSPPFSLSHADVSS